MKAKRTKKPSGAPAAGRRRDEAGRWHDSLVRWAQVLVAIKDADEDTPAEVYADLMEGPDAVHAAEDTIEELIRNVALRYARAITVRACP